ncbi:MAG: hypothetical protein JW941_11560 [Candidatus Coatesbacteria bacterium]|nr:hypothetical protein [Candidatus Coatesbacteria bacterium]
MPDHGASASEGDGPTRKLKTSIVIVVFAALALGLFSRAMIDGAVNDEQAYITAGMLAMDGSVYRDFPYFQMPYLPYIYGAIYNLTGTSHYLLWARMCSFALMLIACSSLFAILRLILRDSFMAMLFIVLFVLNYPIMHIAPLASNQVLPLSFSILAFHSLLKGTSQDGIKGMYVFLAGAAAAIAFGTKLSYLATPVALIISGLLVPRTVDFKARVRGVSYPAWAGLAVAFLPAGFVLFCAGFRASYFNNLGFHAANTAWREAQGYQIGMSFWTKATFILQLLLKPTNAALFLLAICIIIRFLTSKERDAWLSILSRVDVLFSALMIVLTLAIAVQPTPLFFHYFSAPVPFLLILICALYKAVPIAKRRALDAFIICTVVVMSIFGGPVLLRQIHKLNKLDNWVGISTHRTAHAIRERIGSPEGSDKIATLAPIYAIEAGIPIYRELETGPFFYRVWDLLTEDQRRGYVSASPKTLAAVLDREPPAAILVGFQAGLETPFIDYANSHGYIKAEGKFDGGTLYVRNDGR